jgi:penicillin amidase
MAVRISSKRGLQMARWFRFAGFGLLVLLIMGGVFVGVTYRRIAGSLPSLEGEIEIMGLTDRVTIERDALGVPAIRGSNRLDIARALGFVHAQERFFQMDLLRRRAAGELAELFGAAALEADRRSRIHRFRGRAQQRLAGLSPHERDVIASYTEGVNAGLGAIGGRPFEYLLLRVDPRRWTEEDSVLTVLAMYFVLNDAYGRRESDLGLLWDLLPAELAEFLAPAGTEWDAPVVGRAFETPPIPSLDQLGHDVAASFHPSPSESDDELRSLVGSNNWAVDGSRTADGRAILANDMHLPLAVPNTWYRALLEWPAEDDCGEYHRIVGVTLPGTPAVVAGSNGRVAWGFTNSYGDWSDLVIIELDEGNSDRYLTPDGWQEIERHTEAIALRNAEPETLQVEQTIWGPIVDRDHRDRPRALRWIAHDPGGVNLEMLDLEHASSVAEAMNVANRCGIPPQNFVCVEADGSIGWTILGPIPRRSGRFGRVPASWADGTKGWDGWLEPEEYPRIVNPQEGAIWTANARVVGGEMLEVIGDGGYDLGARAGQIRDGLLAFDTVTEAEMLALQLDDRAIFLERWRGLLLDLLDEDAVEGRPQRAEFRDLVKNTWTGRASVESEGFRLVRAFRTFTFEQVYGWLTAPCEVADERFSVHRLPQEEGPLWRLVNERPPHLLNADFASWREWLLAVVDRTVEHFESENGGGLAGQTWGSRNTLSMQHPLSRAVPALSRWLDMPRSQLPGDSNMPRVQSASFGASERMAVSPGHEAEGYFHMPGGQSGHPMSPYFGAGHEAWENGERAPLLPGPIEYELLLVPSYE